MIRVLIVSPEPRLTNAIKNVVGDADYRIEETWSGGQSEVFEKDLDLVLLDFEAMREVAVDSVVPLETVFKDVAAVLLVRQEDRRSREVMAALPSLSLIDMSQGKPFFQAKIEDLTRRIRSATVSTEDRVEAERREARREKDRLAEPERKKTKAYRATEDSAALEHELQGLWMHMRSVDKYELFGAWKGCGRKVIQDRFYLLVKEHHPDVYGGNVSENVKELAQNIFIYVKDTYQDLIRVEKTQKVAPKTETTANPFLRRATTATNTAPIGRTPTTTRQALTTPLAPEETRRPRSTSVIGLEPVKPKVEELSRDEVQMRMQRLSSFRQRQQHRAHRQTLAEASESELSEPSSLDSLEMEISEPEVDPEVDRQARLLELKRKASKVNHPNVQNPAKEEFNDGYRAYRGENFADAFKHFAAAYEINPDDGMHQTFYGYLLFRQFPEKHEEAEEILKLAMNSGHKQAMPDALLFMGHLLKARGEMDKALKHYERALKLNPACVEAERELRLSKIRNDRKSSEPGTFIKNLFKK